MTADRKKIAELAPLVDGEIFGDPDIYVRDVKDIDSAGEGDISFIAEAKYRDKLSSTSASAVIIPRGIEPHGKTVIQVKDPYLASAIIHNFFLKREFEARGIDQRAIIGIDCDIESEVSIAANVVIGDRVKIGKQVEIKAGTVIGDDVVIGEECLIYPNVTILDRTIIGSRVILHSGVVLGSDGFGYAPDEQGRHIKRPQVGFVQIDDEVEIGANSCIDRATFGRTWIMQGTKIDNLVQVGHNCVIGEGCIVVGQVGLGGSSIIGNHVVLAGKAAIKGHLEIGDRCVVAGKAGVTKDLKPGSVVAGMPAMDHKLWLKASIAFAKLPDFMKDLRDQKKKLEQIHKGLDIDNRRRNE